MIQRIQTIYLFLAVSILIAMFFIPFASISLENGGLVAFYPCRLENTNVEAINTTLSVLPFTILLSFITLIIFGCIFMFKNRNMQARLCIFSILLLVGIYGLGFYYITQLNNELNGNINYLYPVVLPLVVIILLFLARNGIVKDENLIRSVDRIR